jgi:hypothetical protein
MIHSRIQNIKKICFKKSDFLPVKIPVFFIKLDGEQGFSGKYWKFDTALAKLELRRAGKIF